MLPWPWTEAEIDTVATRLNAGTLHPMVFEKVVAGEIGFKCRGVGGMEGSMTDAARASATFEVALKDLQIV